MRFDRRALTLRQRFRRFLQGLLRKENDSAEEPRITVMEALAPRLSAEVRARQLLLRCLTSEQREDFERQGCFTVQVPGWGRFRVLPRTMFNVQDTESGIFYCAAPEGLLPLSDQLLAQKLVLENDPERFFRVARRRREEE